MRGLFVASVVMALLLGVGCTREEGRPERTDETGSLEVRDLVVAEPVTGERTALYLTVVNRGEVDETLAGVDLPGLGAASIHRSEMEDGIMRMRPVPEVVVPAGEEIRFRPGGLHVMIEDLERTLEAGDTVEVVLRLRNAGRLPVPALVVRYAELETSFPEHENVP